MRPALRAIADPGRAEGMRAYMKSTMPYLGVVTAGVRETSRDVLSRHQLASFDDWQATIRALWDEAAFREERYVALAILEDRRFRAFRTLEALPLYADLITSGAWWDLVDGIATHLIGDLLRAEPEAMAPILIEWSAGDELWLRRSSIICQVGFKRATLLDLLFACIAPNLAEKNFFIRKAIGWALRELAKSQPDVVRAYVIQHETELSTLSRREALKHLQSAAASA